MKLTISGRLRRLRNVAGRISIVVGALVLGRIVWHFTQRDDAQAIVDGRAEGDLVARRDYLAAHVTDAARSLSGKSDQFAGEWSLVTLSMTALGAANVGFEHSSTVPADLELVARCAELARAPAARAFDAQRWGDDPIDAMNGPNAHIGYLGHLAIVLEADRLLGGRDADLVALEPKVIAALAGKLGAAPDALLPTYPGETYVADNAVVLAAIALADVGRGARASGDARHAGAHAALIDATLAAWRKKLVDPETGVFVFGPGDRAKARASGAALTAMMLGWVDEPLALAQGKALVEHFDTHVLWLFDALCENPACGPGGGDVDSGPLVLGASPSATGFALALAKRNRDAARLGDDLATAEWAGLGFSWSGNRRYVFAPLVGDAVVLAAMSARAWDVRYL